MRWRVGGKCKCHEQFATAWTALHARANRAKLTLQQNFKLKISFFFFFSLSVTCISHWQVAFLSHREALPCKSDARQVILETIVGRSGDVQAAVFLRLLIQEQCMWNLFCSDAFRFPLLWSTDSSSHFLLSYRDGELKLPAVAVNEVRLFLEW